VPLKVLSPNHPLWLAGFRPFFVLAIFFGSLMPALWGFVFSGRLNLPVGMNPLQWHAHEMFFGLGGAVLIGFLLTASKNWVKVRGIHGRGLMILVVLFAFERFFIYYAFDVEPVFRHVGLSVFFAASVFYILGTLFKHRRNDSFSDNYFFVILLGLILIAKNLLISDSFYQHGTAMTVGLFRLAFAVMFERTMLQFMKNSEGHELYRNKILDLSIKLSVLVAAFQGFFSPVIAASILILTGSLLFVRWILWRPDLGLKKFSNATMYAGYLGLVIHFFVSAIQLLDIWSFGTIALHTFTLLCLGLVVPSMLIRISQGHTGRKPQFLAPAKIALSLIFISALVRLLLPLAFPAYYSAWIMTAGLLWSVAFLILGFWLVPYLFQERIDGKEH
jgi:uncharacterized protein involved in response to NO